MMTLENVLDAVRLIVQGLPENKFFEDAPPEQLSDFELPAIIVYSPSGELQFETSDGGNGNPVASGSRVIVVDFHMARTDLKSNFRGSMKFADLIPMRLMKAFMVDRIGGEAITLGHLPSAGAPIRYQFGAMTYGGIKTIGFQFSVDISFHQEIL